MINLEEMKFNNFMDFINRRKELRVYYILLSYNDKWKYKRYIYKLNYKEYVLDLIWCYFNEPKSSPYYVFDYQLMNLMRLYARNKNYIEL